MQNSLHRPIVEQPQYNLIHKTKVESEFSFLYEKMKLGLTIWSPLASGILTGKYLNGIPQGSRASMPSLTFVAEEVADRQNQEKVKKLKIISEKYGISMAHLALGWCMLNPCVSTVILGASNLEQLKQNIETLEYYEKINEFKKELDLI